MSFYEPSFYSFNHKRKAAGGGAPNPERFHNVWKTKYIDSVLLEPKAANQPFPELRLIVDCSVQEVPRYPGYFTDAKILFSPKHDKYC